VSDDLLYRWCFDILQPPKVEIIKKES